MKKQNFFRMLGRGIWKFLVLLYAVWLFPMDALETLFGVESSNTLEKTTITFKMYWYR